MDEILLLLLLFIDLIFRRKSLDGGKGKGKREREKSVNRRFKKTRFIKRLTANSRSDRKL